MLFAILRLSSSFAFQSQQNIHYRTIIALKSPIRAMECNLSSHPSQQQQDECPWQSINALTLRTSNMPQSCEFYKKLGLVISFGGPDSPFTTMAPSRDSSKMHNVYVNLEHDENWCCSPNQPASWGRAVFHVTDVDAMYTTATDAGIQTEFSPRDAPWGERYFHVIDPAGHELSFAKRIAEHPRWKE